MGIADRLIERAMLRPPSFMVGDVADPYLLRWHILPRNSIFNIYIHHFLRSDEDRALHDHPYWNLSILLRGSYTECTIAMGGVNKRVIRMAGDFKFRSAKYAHRIELHDGPCWTMFITGPRIREWGFHCPQGWRHWTVFIKSGAPGEVGKGCD